MSREVWLHGWTRDHSLVLLGTSWWCAGCGAYQGLGCVGFDGTPAPPQLPAWPFDAATCPLCELREKTYELYEKVWRPEDKLTERLLALRKDKMED